MFYDLCKIKSIFYWDIYVGNCSHGTQDQVDEPEKESVNTLGEIFYNIYHLHKFGYSESLI